MGSASSSTIIFRSFSCLCILFIEGIRVKYSSLEAILSKHYHRFSGLRQIIFLILTKENDFLYQAYWLLAGYFSLVRRRFEGRACMRGFVRVRA
jgi:hypothetical protein